MLAKENLLYLDGRLAGDINAVYSDIINCEVVKPPYSVRARNTSFFFNKRKGFRPKICNDGSCQTNTIFAGGTVTDIVRIDGKRYYMRINNAQTKLQIYRDETDAPDNCCVLAVGKPQCFTPGGYDKFLKTTFVKGQPRVLCLATMSTQSDKGVQINAKSSSVSEFNADTDTFSATTYQNVTASVVGTFNYVNNLGENIFKTTANNPPDGQFRDDSGCPYNFGPGGIQVGDYIFAHGLGVPAIQDITGIPSQVGIITGLLSPNTLDVRSSWAGFSPTQLNNEGANMIYEIYPDRGDVFVFNTCEGFKMRTHDISVIEDFINVGLTEESSKFAQYNNGRLIYLTNDGYLNYGGVGTQQFYHTVDQTFFVGTDVISTPTFNQYTLIFTNSSLQVAFFDYDKTGTLLAFLGSSDLNIGLFSRDSYTTYLGSFLFLGSNKRLYTLSLQPTTFGTFATKIEDNSLRIKGDLDLIMLNDKVFIQADNQNLTIYINGDRRESGVISKSKILIYDKDFLFRHKRVSCCAVVSAFKEGYYIGDSVYNYCGYEDCFDCETQLGQRYTQEISLYLGENEVNSSGLSMRTNKMLTMGSFLVGINSELTNGNFEMKIESYTNCYKPILTLKNIEDICYVDLINKVKLDEIVDPTKDAMVLINDCNNYDQPCKNSGDNVDTLVPSVECNCPEEPQKHDDYCICVDDKKFFLSSFSKVNLNVVENIRATMYKITFKTIQLNRLEFGGVMIPYRQNRPEDKHTMCDSERYCKTCKGPVCTCNPAPIDDTFCCSN